jgi:site-specific recombinase XerC
MHTRQENASDRRPWNLGRTAGAKPPLKPKHIWSLRTRLEIANRVRDLAIVNLAIDSKLRGCDLVFLKVGDVFSAGSVRARSVVIQHKTSQPVPLELTEPTKEALLAWLKLRRAEGSDWLWPRRSHEDEHMTTRQYGR